MFPAPYLSGSINSNPPNITTAWYNTHTSFPTPNVVTFAGNLTTASLVAARTSLCPITPYDFLNGVTEGDLPDDCDALIEPYCWPDPDARIPPSTTFPLSCTPYLGDAASTNTSTSMVATSVRALPSPVEPGIIAICKQYYMVLSGDTCDGITKNFKLSLGRFYSWNPSVGTDCTKLFLGFYVCIAA